MERDRHGRRGTRRASGVLLALGLALACASTSGPDLSAEATALLPPAFPLYPGARIERVDRHELPAPAGSAPSDAPAPYSVSAVFAIDEPPDQVVPTYTGLLKTQGWKPRVRRTQGDQAIVGRHGRNTALLFVRSDGDGSRIDLLVVRKEKRRKARKRRRPPDVPDAAAVPEQPS